MLTEKAFSFTLLLLLCLHFGLNVQSNDTNEIYYISLGDSFAAGVEITGPPPGNRTTPAYSYANALYDLLKVKYPNLELLKLGISGETSDGLIEYQLNNATDFMTSHKGLTKFITITIGANDIHRTHLINNLNNTIIPQLKEAGGENVQYMASTYYKNTSLAYNLIDVYGKNGFKVVDLRTIITNDTLCNYTYLCTYNDIHLNEAGNRAV
ncbi:17603_t:CDS:1, partial [Gigaspora margarita]